MDATKTVAPELVERTRKLGNDIELLKLEARKLAVHPTMPQSARELLSDVSNACHDAKQRTNMVISQIASAATTWRPEAAATP